ncbi:MAG TPA: TlpA disulfide reductase family protein [Candidatus Baltobacteraceae bacterium]|nr:TlpA disulfide reductase family protein [Candidatus Baltobacteraceae bacterium]
MNAGLRRSGASIAALLLLALAIASLGPLRPFAYQIASRLGLTARLVAPRVGQPLRPLHLTTLAGARTVLVPAPGRALLVNVFATWCPSCREETPLLARLAPRLAKAGIQVVGIDQDESPQATARFVREFGLSYPIYLDQGRSTAIELDARVIPTTVLVDRRHVVRSVFVGPLDTADVLSLTKLAQAAP